MPSPRRVESLPRSPVYSHVFSECSSHLRSVGEICPHPLQDTPSPAALSEEGRILFPTPSGRYLRAREWVGALLALSMALFKNHFFSFYSKLSSFVQAQGLPVLTAH